MALTVTSRGTGTHNTGATTLVPDGRNATFAVGSMGVLCIALDNAGTAGSALIAPDSWTDAKGNVWTLRTNRLYDNGAASAGIEMAFYTAPITVALLTTDAGTMTWKANSPVAKAWTWYEVIPSGANSVDYSTGGDIAGATAANAQVTTASVLVGDAVIAGYFSENVNAVTGDSDTTNGTWTAQQTATVGSGTSGVRIATQQKVQTTAASTQSYDVTVASQDRIAGYIMLHEIVALVVTPGVVNLTTATFAPTVTVTNHVTVTVPTAGGGAASAHVQNLGADGNGTAGQTSTVLSPASKTVAVGNTVVVGWGGFSDITPSGVTDNLGNTYSRIERIRGTNATTDLWYAPVTTGGSITTITVAHASTQYVWMTAAEISGVGPSPSVGSGGSGSVSSPATWTTNKTIPALGLAIGAVTSTTSDVLTAGSASGTPSTTIVLSVWFNGGANLTGGLGYAIAGASEVTGFNGTLDVDTPSGSWSGAGGQFAPIGGGGLVLATFAPTVTATANQLLVPAAASLVTQLFAPTVSAPALVTPTTASLATATFAPTISAGANVTVTPDPVALTTSLFAPTVSATAHVIATPDVANLVTATFAPTVTATANTTVTPRPVDGLPLYGSAINFESLNNCQIGGADLQSASDRFRAEQTSSVQSVRIYWVDETHPGYGGGTGGAIRVAIHTDDGTGLPSGTVLGFEDIGSPNDSAGALTTFDPAIAVTAGSRYHVVFTNLDAAPQTNFVSIDNIFNYGDVMVPRQPGRSDDDYAECRRYGAGAWFVHTQDTPLIDIAYTNGAHQGIGYPEVEVANAATIQDTTNMARERITVTGGNRIVTGAAIFGRRSFGTEPLLVRLEESDGTLIDSFEIPASVYTPTVEPGDSDGSLWGYGSFSQPRTLVSGSTYNLRLSTGASTKYTHIGIQQGLSYGYDAATYFADGVAELTTNGTTWVYFTGMSSDGDLQFYLTVPSLQTSLFAPTVVTTANIAVTPDVATLTTALFAPTVTASDHKLVTPPPASLTLSTFAPTVTAVANVTVTPDVVALTLLTFAPGVQAGQGLTIIPTTAALTLSTFAPTVSATAHIIATPPTASLVTALFAPTVTAPALATPDFATLTLSSFAPTVATPTTITPTTLSLAMTAFAPDVVLTDHVLAVPSPAALVLSTFAPEVESSGTVVPATASLILTTFAPLVTAPPPETLPEMDELGVTITSGRVGLTIAGASIDTTITTTSIGAEVT